MRRNVAAGIGSNEQGEYCRAALQRSDRKEPRYKWLTLLYLHRNAYVVIAYFHSSTIKQEIETFYISPCYAFAFNVM